MTRVIHRAGIEYTIIPCLKCLKLFPSVDVRKNRICTSCNNLNKTKRMPPPREVGFKTVDSKRLKSI